MTIRQLSLTDFRNLNSTTLEFHPQFNLIVGDNGGGKTSLLEAIHVLCEAQSFRTHQLKQCIAHERDSFLLFARFDGFKAGLSKSAKKLEIHVNAEPLQRRSELVRRVPIKIVNADTFALIDGSPGKRRAYLDWCLFHVEHSYAEAWARFRHALKQRNQLLRSGRDLKLIDYWNDHLVQPSLVINEMRQSFSQAIGELLSQEFGHLLPPGPVDVDYHQGWPETQSLQDVLIEQRHRDIRSGFTNSGIHRDDLVIKSRGKEARSQLSRGESKRLCLAMTLSALKLVSDRTGKRIVLLIDDLSSELDDKALTTIYQALGNLDLQLFITNINHGVPEPLEGKEFKLFHVEHGTIKPRNFS